MSNVRPSPLQVTDEDREDAKYATDYSDNQSRDRSASCSSRIVFENHSPTAQKFVKIDNTFVCKNVHASL